MSAPTFAGWSSGACASTATRPTSRRRRRGRCSNRRKCCPPAGRRDAGSAAAIGASGRIQPTAKPPRQRCLCQLRDATQAYPAAAGLEVQIHYRGTSIPGGRHRWEKAGTGASACGCAALPRTTTADRNRIEAAVITLTRLIGRHIRAEEVRFAPGLQPARPASMQPGRPTAPRGSVCARTGLGTRARPPDRRQGRPELRTPVRSLTNPPRQATSRPP